MSDINAWFHIRNLGPFIYNQEVHTHQNLDLIVLFKDINSFLYVLSVCLIISNGALFSHAISLVSPLHQSKNNPSHQLCNSFI